jgi:hypothetical protein
VKGSDEMEIVELTDKVFRYYSKKVKDNKNITYDQARLKLTRNIMLADIIPPRDESDIEKGNTLYQYGNLLILVRNGTVIHLKNHRGEPSANGWKDDPLKYEELTKEFGIVS